MDWLVVAAIVDFLASTVDDIILLHYLHVFVHSQSITRVAHVGDVDGSRYIEVFTRMIL